MSEKVGLDVVGASSDVGQRLASVLHNIRILPQQGWKRGSSPKGRDTLPG